MITYNVFTQNLDKLELLYNRVMADVRLANGDIGVMSNAEDYINYYRTRLHRPATQEMCILANKHYKALKSIQKRG